MRSFKVEEKWVFGNVSPGFENKIKIDVRIRHGLPAPSE